MVLFEYSENEYNYLCGYLYPYYNDQNMYHTIFSYAYRNISDYVIASSFHFYKKYENEEKKRKALMTIILNQVSPIPLNDRERREQVQRAFLVGMGGNLRLTQNIIDDIGDDTPGTLKSHFDCTKNFIQKILQCKYIDKIGQIYINFYNMPKFLHQIDINDSEVRSVHISNAEAIEMVSFPDSSGELCIYACKMETPIDLSEFKNLKKITIERSNNVKFSASLSSVEELNICGCKPEAPIDLSPFVKLQNLEIHGSKVDFSTLPNSLVNLDINGCKPEAPIALSPLGKLQNLRVYYSKVDFLTLPNSLVNLDIIECKPEAPINLSPFVKLRKLAIFGLEVNFSAPLSSLEELVLTSALLSVDRITSLPQLEKLEKLDIDGLIVTFPTSLPSLNELRISKCRSETPINLPKVKELEISESDVNLSTIPSSARIIWW
ncbi:MAG: hypothetical protein LBJ96_04080 [Holosporaceae bacterium]|jgi:hypothetical protein|nr:hypothetical protein [Holosporaceae bacterium]